ncbi:response regulator transcription factor [Schleiferilactobacillus shenzhenensis]|uniref:DesR n=1 Tax=Schleiferilactobacillus shenzhenensis LY-73 TaxID=1231336 RepID=U4TM01_9LACO|nr:response regulator transcription factor [Schleiferilactobacillus shenzhenensis]ERL65239.1 DesR [Schleiferilactobacillus shenzhenensis LY-73]
MIRLFLAEDQSLLNTALAQLLDLEDDITVVGTATDGQAAWAAISQLKPDLAVLDIEMPKATGLDVADLIQGAHLPTKVVILTTFAQSAYFQRAVKAGVAGYLLKDAPTDELVANIRRIMAGATVYAPELVQNMVTASTNPLSEREMDVLKAAANGQSTKEIAQTLFLSAGTVRNYLSAIFSKLGVANRMEAVNLAKRNKWL